MHGENLKLIGDFMECSSCGIIWCTFLAFAWKAWRDHKILQFGLSVFHLKCKPGTSWVHTRNIN